MASSRCSPHPKPSPSPIPSPIPIPTPSPHPHPQVLATAGDTHLGGEDLDNRLIKHLLALIAKRHKVEI